MPNRLGCLTIAGGWIIIGLCVWWIVSGCKIDVPVNCIPQQTTVRYLEQPEECQDVPYTMKQQAYIGFK